GECGEPAADAAAGRTVSELPVLRQSPDGGHTGGEPQTHAAPDGDSRNRSSLSETQLEPPGAWARGLSLPASRRLDRAAQSSLEHRYYVYSDAGRLPVSGRRHGVADRAPDDLDRRDALPHRSMHVGAAAQADSIC